MSEFVLVCMHVLLVVKWRVCLQVLRFYGNVAVRVIGGVVKLESYAMMSSADYLPLNIPFHANSMAMSMEAVDPGTHVR